MPSVFGLPSAMPASAVWYAASIADCCDAASFSSTARLTAATAASTDAPGAGFSVGLAAFGYWRVIALTASKTAVCRTASVALPGGPGWCAVMISPALRFQSVTTSARDASGGRASRGISSSPRETAFEIVRIVDS